LFRGLVAGDVREDHYTGGSASRGRVL
jgi:hypothetical protein